jgi:hypothetical protein
MSCGARVSVSPPEAMLPDLMHQSSYQQRQLIGMKSYVVRMIAKSDPPRVRGGLASAHAHRSLPGLMMWIGASILSDRVWTAVWSMAAGSVKASWSWPEPV